MAKGEVELGAEVEAKGVPQKDEREAETGPTSSILGA